MLGAQGPEVGPRQLGEEVGPLGVDLGGGAGDGLVARRVREAADLLLVGPGRVDAAGFRPRLWADGVPKSWAAAACSGVMMPPRT